MKRLILLVFALLMLGAVAARADESFLPQVDLILPPALESADAPFYRGAKVKVDDTVIPVAEEALPPGSVAEFRPDRNVIIVSNSDTVSEADKGQALLDVLSALQVGDIATAAGQ